MVVVSLFPLTRKRFLHHGKNLKTEVPKQEGSSGKWDCVGREVVEISFSERRQQQKRRVEKT